MMVGVCVHREGSGCAAVCEKPGSPREGCVLSDGGAEPLVFLGVPGAQGHCWSVPFGKRTRLTG